MQVANQFKRIFSDDGRGDKDFAEAEARLHEAQKHLWAATDMLTRVSDILTGLIKTKGLIHH